MKVIYYSRSFAVLSRWFWKRRRKQEELEEWSTNESINGYL